jgi:hypothetical protein
MIYNQEEEIFSMTPFEQFIQSLSINSFDSVLWIFVKILFAIGFGLYLAFAVIIIRQVKIMGEVVEGLSVWPLRILAWVHLLVAIFLFLLTLIVL